MKDSFDEFMELCKKSIRHDPWVKSRGLHGYCEEISAEAKESIEAAQKQDYEHLREELGDVLLDWCHAILLAEEAGHFTGKDVLEEVRRKLLRRKPYLLENRTPTREEARLIWKRVKAEEKAEQTYLVDENNEVLGRVSRARMRKENLWHRGVAVLTFNREGDILIHKRVMEKDIYPGCLDLMNGGVSLAGESYEEAAVREVEEELGIKNPKLEFLFMHKYENARTKVFIAVYRQMYSGAIHIQKSEIEYARFVPLAHVQTLLTQEEFTPDGLEIFQRYLKEKHG